MSPTPLHDIEFNIAESNSAKRETRNWKNIKRTWTWLLERTKTTVRTFETHAEYMAMTPDRQGEVKDIGGFVGAYLNNGRRKKGSVVSRRLLTLDIDFAKPGFWQDFAMLYDTAAIVYSTHKHSPEKPRLRMIVPLDRDVKPDEYEAIARRFAGDIDIELFDPSTFQPERLMYWPSTPKDGEYEYNSQDGSVLCANDVLAQYVDWRDTSSWPVSSKVSAQIRNGMKEQGDPLEKKGLVGGFCRMYGIHDVIAKFLVDQYTHCDDKEDRYTYVQGSTAAGLVVYDDKFAYSHHGTDPISGKLCNAFDLVRIHLFGVKDLKMDLDAPITKMPSFRLMIEKIKDDPDVRGLLARENIDIASYVFADDYDMADPLPDAPAGGPGYTNDAVAVMGEEPIDTDWLKKLQTDNKGNIDSNHFNIDLVLANDPHLRGCFGYDQFRKRPTVLRHLPWRKVEAETRYLCDEDEMELTKYLSNVYSILNRLNTKDCIYTAIRRNTFHPVRDYLDTLNWDGVRRIDKLFVNYMGADDTEYVHMVGRKTLVAAVARVMEPGIKFDFVTTIVGPEGEYKSTLFRKLGGAWFSDSFSFSLLNKNNAALEAIQGVWITEVGELSGLRRTELEAVKHFISKQEDSWRGAFRHFVDDFRRQGIFVATTNDPYPLIQSNGNRRWWLIAMNTERVIKSVSDDLTAFEVGQMWAEAYELYKARETLYLPKHVEEDARRIQKQHTEKDDRTGIIIKYLNTAVPEDWEEMPLNDRRAFFRQEEDGEAVLAISKDGYRRRDHISVADIYMELFGGMMRDMTSTNTKPLHKIMQSIEGWRKARVQRISKISGKQMGYERIPVIAAIIKNANGYEFL